MIFHLLGWSVLGLIAGFIASKMVNLRGDDPRLGFALGAIGAVVAGWIFSAFSIAGVQSFNPWSFITAFAGSIALLVGWHAMRAFANRSPARRY
jgi:uncharacterized membrane protein YeaQ/YmgE (transglycosylase-associated protein family)